MTAIASALAGIRAGAAVACGNLTMFPLIGSPDGEPFYLTLHEALAAGTARVTEVSELGSVPELKFVNAGPKPVLLLDGEELVGAKQNRIINLSILVGAHSELLIPVSCVEAGRWQHRSEEFSTAERAFFSRGRARKLADVSESLSESGMRRTNQGAVWSDIGAKSARMRVDSHTSAAAAMYEANAVPLDAFVAAMQAVEAQVGAVFAINGALVGLDLFDSPATWARQARKLVTSYALDAIDEAGLPAAPTEPCDALLDEMLGADCRAFKAVGLGEDLRLQGSQLHGAALAYEGRVVHACAFRDESAHAESNAAGSGRMASAKRRRAHLRPLAD